MRYLLLQLALFMVLLVSRSVAAQATTASSSCTKPRTQIEYRVCRSPYATLKDLDREMEKWYRRALSANTDKAALRLDQQQWIQSLDQCLTSASIEPVRYVCDSVLDPTKKNQCFQDFCLVARYHERSRVLHRLVTARLPSRYLVSSEWPTGIHEHMWPMEEANRPLCFALNSRLSGHGPLAGPLLPDSTFRLPPPWPSIASRSFKQPDLLPLAQRLEVLLRQKWRRPGDLVFTSSFTELLASRIASGELDVSEILAGSENTTGRVLRYQRWTRNTRTTALDTYNAVEFFHSLDNDLASLVPIRDGDDAFVFRNEVFIAQSSVRGFDNAWQRLPLGQPELYLYKIALQPPEKPVAIPVCHLVYSGPL